MAGRGITVAERFQDKRVLIIGWDAVSFCLLLPAVWATTRQWEGMPVQPIGWKLAGCY